jgi:hypothetical protein
LKGLAVAVVVAAVLVPAAAAKSRAPAPELPSLLSLPQSKLGLAAAKSHHSGVKLALLPLPKSKLGPAAAHLKIAFGSGPQPSYSSEEKKLGRVTGYMLMYGSPFLANPGLDEVSTSVDAYKTARKAKHAVPYWKKEEFGSFFKQLTQLNLTATVAALPAPAIGGRHWAELVTMSVPNYGSVYLVSEELSDGKYVLDLEVAAGSQALAKSYAAAKARLLDKRLHLGLNGRLHGHPAALPEDPPDGPPATGFDPATAALEESDLPGAEIQYQGYDWFSGALSSYDVEFQPGGSFDSVEQTINVMPTTNSAGFVASFIPALAVAEFVSYGGPNETIQVTPVDVSAVGDEAQAYVLSISGPSETEEVAVVALHSGPVADIVYALETTNLSVDPADVQTLAQSAATRLDAALP